MLNALGAAVVEARDVTVAIGGRPVLRGNDLVVHEGEFVALMGANGSGKSTLVRALTGLRPLTSGSVSLFGTPLADFHEHQRIGFVPQRGHGDRRRAGQRAGGRGLGPADPTPTCCGRWAAPTGARSPTPSRSSGSRDRAGDGISTLSGGQQQRVLIARALAGEPELFFLDEPTAGVDLPNQQALAAALRTLSERGATVVLVAHELGPLAPLVDRAVVLRDGRVAYDGPPARRGSRALAPPPDRGQPRPRAARRLPPRLRWTVADESPHEIARCTRTSAGTPMNLVDLLGLDFMHRALLAALFTGLAAPAIGTFLVQKRLALLGDGIGHIAVTGVALGLLTGTSPTWTAVVVAIIGAVVIEVIREQGHTNGDVALALLFYGGLAGGVLITGLDGQGANSLHSYLFGSVTSISSSDVWFTLALAVGDPAGDPGAAPAAVRRRLRPGVRPGRGAACPRLQHPRRGAGRRHASPWRCARSGCCSSRR